MQASVKNGAKNSGSKYVMAAKIYCFRAPNSQTLKFGIKNLHFGDGVGNYLVMTLNLK